MKFSNSILSLMLSTHLLSGCGWTSTYSPKNPNRTYLVMKSGNYALARGGRIIDAEQSFSSLVVCDPAARQSGLAAEARFRNGRQLTMVATVLNTLVIGAVAFYPLLAIAQRETDHGVAATVDAVNQSNDADSCTNRETSFTAR